MECSDPSVISLLDFDNIVDEFKKRNDICGLIQFFENNNRALCRQQMIILKRFDILEEMDNNKYIAKEY